VATTRPDQSALGLLARRNAGVLAAFIALLFVCAVSAVKVSAQDASRDPSHAQSTWPAEPPPTFAYTTPADKNYLRAFLELGGVIGFGFLQYITEQDIVRNYDVNYSWKMFRGKLLFEQLKLDTNHLGTNFIGHPIGGTSYYMTARGNHLSIAESFGFTVAGSTLWEYFGEVREIVSINDMIVTSLAGPAIGEPMTQLGAFFDRSSPALRNRILGVFFGPVKSLNDLLDGRTLARSEHLDYYGFPADEWHQFDLSTGVGNTWEQHPTRGVGSSITQEWRYALSSHLARLPDYVGAGHHSLVFSDGNVSSFEVSGAVTEQRVVDLHVETQLVLVGHYFRDAHRDSHGKLWGYGTQIGVTTGYELTFHDYDRDGFRPIDQIAGVEPLGLLFEHRGAFGAGRIFTRFSATSDFAGVRPYALRMYRQRADKVVLPYVLDQHLYYYGIGGRLMGHVGVSAGLFEIEAKLRFEGYSALEEPVALADQRASVEGRVSCEIPYTAARVAAFIERRSRWGYMGPSQAARNELSLGVEIGARY
jgi:hypothetical protein